MTRRAIRASDSDDIFARAKRARVFPVIHWSGVRESVVERIGAKGRDLTHSEIEALAAVGIHPGADGWEIEEAPSAPRPPLPPGFGWYEHGHESYGLDRRRPAGEETIAKAHHDGYSWAWSIASRHVRTTARDLREAQERAEDACRAAGLFDVPTVDRAQAIRDALIERLRCSPLPTMDDLLNLLSGRDGRPMVTVSEATVALASIGAVCNQRVSLSDGPPRGWEWRDGTIRKGSRILARVGLDVCAASIIVDGDSIQWRAEIGTAFHASPSIGEAESAALLACRRAGLFAAVEQAPTAPDLGAKVDAAGAPPTGAARTLMTLLLRATSLGEMPGTQPTLAERLDAMEHLCEAFVAELRASLPAAPMPAPRTTDGALTAYLLEHHREAWRPGEDALALAIRLLGDLNDTIADTREEARVADENAKELEAELGKVRAALAREEARRIEAERGRGEALGDLATVRNDVLKTAADLAAKMGAPHG